MIIMSQVTLAATSTNVLFTSLQPQAIVAIVRLQVEPTRPPLTGFCSKVLLRDGSGLDDRCGAFRTFVAYLADSVTMDIMIITVLARYLNR